jgi:hypothetical protein
MLGLLDYLEKIKLDEKVYQTLEKKLLIFGKHMVRIL